MTAAAIVNNRAQIDEQVFGLVETPRGGVNDCGLDQLLLTLAREPCLGHQNKAVWR